MEAKSPSAPMSNLASNTAQAAAQANTAGKPPNIDAINKTANEFEALFLAEYLKIMFEGTDTPAPFGGGSAEASYKPMLLDEYAKSFNRNGGIGIADAVAREMIALQAAQAGAEPPSSASTPPVAGAR